MGGLSNLRGVAQMLVWYAKGMPLPPVPAVKRRLLRHYAKAHGLEVFIETGTFKGDTLAAMAAEGMRAISIELSEALFKRAGSRFAGRNGIELHHGDSGEILPRIVSELTEPALFWLDGHYSAGKTAHGKLASPINSELAAIFDHPVKGHVVLIDDAHEFTGAGGYPELGRFLTSIAEDGRYRALVHSNIIVLEPKG
jgi:hypothetical protein